MTILAWAFWISAAMVIYAYAGYPLLLSLLARRAGAAQPIPDDASLPTATLIVPAHNERATIDAKLANTRALDYPAGRLQVLFVSDGSTDGTTEAIREALDDRTEVLEITTRGGKAGALNAGLTQARHDIVVFTDASIMLEPGAIRAIVRPFADPAVGASRARTASRVPAARRSTAATSCSSGARKRASTRSSAPAARSTPSGARSASRSSPTWPPTSGRC